MKKMVTKASAVFFSATHTTEKVVTAIAKGTGLSLTVYNCSKLYAQPEIPVFGPEELVIIGGPVYVGLVPKFFLPIVDGLRGSGTPAVLAGVYGNRHYDDFLAELYDLVVPRGFLPVAAGAFVGEHSFSDKLATGRPGAEDLAKAEKFGADIAVKLKNQEEPALAAKDIAGNRPYRVAFGKASPIAPVISSAGSCAKACPSGAISPAVQQGDKNINKEKCLRCRACARACPVKAIDFEDKRFWGHTEELIKNYFAFRPVELFI